MTGRLLPGSVAGSLVNCFAGLLAASAMVPVVDEAIVVAT